jgi:purine-binding chemotaxis protein CheW
MDTMTAYRAPTQFLSHELTGSVPQASQQYLTFMLGEKTFATSIHTIKEIIEDGELMEVPCMPYFILGVINLRGLVVPVIDLNARFGKPLLETTRHTRIVIFEVASEGEVCPVGVKVDAVNAVLDIPEADIQAAPALGADIRTDFISGMVRIDDRFVIILNIAHVLSLDEMMSLLGVSSDS